jgi:hypothetical protein
MALPVFQATSVGDKPTPVPATPTAGRIALLVINRGPNNLYLGSTTTTVYLLPNEGVKFKANERDILNARCDSGGSATVHTIEEISQQ